MHEVHDNIPSTGSMLYTIGVSDASGLVNAHTDIGPRSGSRRKLISSTSTPSSSVQLGIARDNDVAVCFVAA